MTIAKEFLKRAESSDFTVAIAGMGYVGVPLAEAYVRQGVHVIGYDINEKTVEQLNAGKSGMRHIEDKRIKEMVDKKLFRATTRPGDLVEADAILICVPTPLDVHHQPDLSYVVATCNTLKEHLRKGQLIALESTTYPGTTDEVMRPILEESGLKAGKDFMLAYSPEREDPGNLNFETSTIPKVVGADSEAALAAAKVTYDKIVQTVMVSNTRTAEATKLLENIYRWINIGAINEMKLIFEKLDIDIWEVIDAAKTKPFGFQAFYPGPGVGGHCIRIDPYYLSYKAREQGMSTQFIDLAGEVNVNMPRTVVMRLLEQLSLRSGKALRGAKILLCGVAYKKNIDDARESPALEVFDLLEAQGAEVDFYDPFIEEIPPLHEHPNLVGRKSIEWSKKALKKYDAALIATDHTNVDYETLCLTLDLVVDTRNATRPLSEKAKASVILA